MFITRDIEKEFDKTIALFQNSCFGRIRDSEATELADMLEDEFLRIVYDQLKGNDPVLLRLTEYTFYSHQAACRDFKMGDGPSR